MTIVREIIDHTGVVDELLIFSYSVTDVWIRQLLNLRHEKSIGKIIMVLDYDVMIRHREKLNQLQFVADEVYLTDTHAKVYIAKNKNTTTAAVTSANATNNLRNECYYITDAELAIRFENEVRGLLEKSSRII